ncbi:MAG: 16S rRNA (guanine(966)-N(2))-methyltransferase RsmD [Metamycoplasmataceae bacterium]
MIRIISGDFKRRVFKEPDKNKTRVTMDRVRESIFNIINYEIKDKIILDCFSGSGIITGEFLSRNAKKAFAIEKDKEVFEIVKNNLESLNISNYHLLNEDILFFLNKINKEIKFDFIYIDPPFSKFSLLEEVLNEIYEKKLLNKDGQIIIEWNLDISSFLLLKWEIKKTKTFGSVLVYFLIEK